MSAYGEKANVAVDQLRLSLRVYLLAKIINAVWENVKADNSYAFGDPLPMPPSVPTVSPYPSTAIPHLRKFSLDRKRRLGHIEFIRA